METSAGNDLCRFDTRLRSGLAYRCSLWGTSAFLPKGLGLPAEKSQQECAYANHRDIPQASQAAAPLASRRRLFYWREGTQARTLPVFERPRSIGALVYSYRGARDRRGG